MAQESSLETITAQAELAVGGRTLSVRMTVPTGPTRPRELLPLYRSLAESFIAAGVADAVAAGRAVSCRKGCGACCRQLVPIAELEAQRLAEVIAALPEPRRTEVQQRFDAARHQLEEAGLLDVLEQSSRLASGTARTIGLRYFALGIACPFLEDEACSIYEERPIACREYLVTSAAELCAAPTRETVECIDVPVHVSRAIRWLTVHPGEQQPAWVPLILAPYWAAAQNEDSTRAGTDIVRELFSRLSGGQIEDAPR